ncbi:MAG: S41 family peptidase [Paludibacteraceae bacterium]|nr:S41 family peptidase [Paludibacteraceae bacterium]
MKSKFLWTPLLMALAAIVGVYIGKYAGRSQALRILPNSGREMYLSGSTDKMQMILNLIRSEYVDNVGLDTLVESLIPSVLENLDPHSVYIPAKDFERVNSDLKSDFGGVGIQFSVSDDTVNVVSVVAGGPSSLLGVMPGDKIIKVDGKSFVGDTITNDLVMHTLRGEVGSSVDIAVKRGDMTLDFSIIRGVIPMTSVDVSYMLDSEIGYMRIDRFAEKTYEEMLKGIAKLKADGCSTLIVDLRGNSGGLLDVVIKMCNEFLAAGELIVYTEGAHQRREEARANGLGTCQQLGVAVLIDEYSASASEIFAGAIQDNDRGIVVGRRSFGKGLVQTQLPLGDNSAVRLTIARYHTPSGRCIQRPYDEGTASYYDELFHRYESGELFEADSVKFDESQMFATKNGRTVFGGGGIMPDFFVPRDTAKASDYLYRMRAKGVIYKYALEYADKHRSKLSSMSIDELISYLKMTDMMPGLMNYASSKGVKQSVLSDGEYQIVNNEVKAYIGRNIKDNEAFYPIFNERDRAILKAMDEIRK